ncbi:MAG: penicillin-binding protein 1C, partial [Polyangiales bacterium]
LLIGSCFVTVPSELLIPTARDSIRVLDRDGRVMREVRADDGSRARWTPLEDLAPTIVPAIVAAEDRRFYDHHGVDPLAVARAVATSLWHRRIVSGASTLTMQLARTVAPHPKTLFGKLGEMAMALKIERTISKARIVEEYVNRVDFGPHLRGLPAASEAWLGKRARDLSLSEASLLAGLPRGPSLYALDRSPQRAHARRSTVLARMVRAGAITEAQRDLADASPIVVVPSDAAPIAPHFVEGLVAGRVRARSQGVASAWSNDVSEIATTIDVELQRAAEVAAKRTIDGLASKHVTAASVVVIDNATSEILAWIGSPDVHDAARQGANDGVVALRQPGSALKPLLYALAIERLGFTPATILPDVELHLPTSSGTWVPRNYDDRFHGPVSVREALGSSLNVPAAWTVDRVGVPAFLDRLRASGFDSLTESADHYGPAIALGDGEVTLLALTNAYATFTRGGEALPVRAVRSLRRVGGAIVTIPIAERARVVDPIAAALVTDVLKDRSARLRSFGDATPLDFDFEVAAKTGTSKGFRDNWCVGFSGAVTVGVWVGNFDGSPMQEVSGITGAAPLFREVMSAAMRTRAATRLAIDAASAPADLVKVDTCPLSGHRAGAHCHDRVKVWMPIATAEALPDCEQHVRLAIDRRNGLRAGPACAPSEVEERVFERFPTIYLPWATDDHRPLVPSATSPFCPSTEAIGPATDAGAREATLAIRRPLDGTRWVVDPETPRDKQAIVVELDAPASATSVTLLVDDVAFATKRAPFVFSWPIVEGTHRLVGRDDHGATSGVVSISVRR